MKLSSGDWIAVLIGGVAVLRWAWDIVGHWLERGVDHAEIEEGKLTQLLSDLRAHEAQDRIEFKWIKEALGRVERKVDNLQRQMAFAAAGVSNRIMEVESGDGQV